jgi:excinuclease ABC subunit C
VLVDVIAGLGLTGQIGPVGIAKSRVLSNVKGKVVERSEERFFLAGRKNPLTFRHGSAAAFLLERLRDEAHRFAISFHRSLRSKQGLRSSLDQIPGIGPVRRKELLKHFGSLKRLRAAGVEQIQQVPGFSGARARQLVEALKDSQHD